MQSLLILFPLVTTLLFETGIYMILKHRDLKLFLVASIMNLILNLAMNLTLTYLGDTPSKYWLILGIGEVLTTLIESIVVYLFMRFKYLKILLIAVIANVTSFLVGLALDPLYDNHVILIIFFVLFMLGYIATYLVVFLDFIKKNKELES